MGLDTKWFYPSQRSRMKTIGCFSFFPWLPALSLLAVNIGINGGQKYQVIDGFGVNANHRSWQGDELKPVIDALIDQAGVSIFRVVFDNTDWEATNDNSDPNVMNWDYYNTVYGSASFQKLWDLMAYLNQKGIADTLMLNFMGPGPSWMGGGSLTAGMEAEWSEMIASLLVYAKNTKNLKFGLLAPNNEPDISNEGISMGPGRYAAALHALALQLAANGLTGVRLVGPDRAGGGTDYMSDMMSDSVIMQRLAHFGVHSYSDGGGGSGGVYDFIKGSAYPVRTFWMTEYNVWCSTCDFGTRGNYDWSTCLGTADYLLHHLDNNASGGMVWEGYDSYYNHPPSAWSFWGLFSVDDEKATVKTYTKRKNFFTLAQISKYVQPGSFSIELTGKAAPFSQIQAYYHTARNEFSIVGINTSGSSATLNGTISGIPLPQKLALVYTSSSANLVVGNQTPVNNGAFTVSVPANCIFTLVGSADQTSPATPKNLKVLPF